jgi:hypothetical protein
LEFGTSPAKAIISPEFRKRECMNRYWEFWLGKPASQSSEGQALFEPRHHGFVDKGRLAQVAFPLRILGRCEMAQTRLTAQ